MSPAHAPLATEGLLVERHPLAAAGRLRSDFVGR
jgi:hypothetical protein